MSSGKYFAEITPDPVLRRIVVASGLVLALAGVPLLCMLPLGAAGRTPAIVAWCAWSARELVSVIRQQRSCHGIRFAADGTVTQLDFDGRWRPVRLLPGSILLHRVGWLRIGMGRGQAGAEPVRGHCREGQDWRRLQVLWRHIGAVS